MADALTLADLAARLAADPELLEQFGAAAREAGIARDLLPLLTPKVEEPPEELVIPLRKPVEHAGASYAEMKLREPTVSDLMAIYGKQGPERIAELIFVMTAIPMGAIKKMKARDLEAAADYLDRFF